MGHAILHLVDAILTQPAAAEQRYLATTLILPPEAGESSAASPGF
jgi:hypothetical protein